MTLSWDEDREQVLIEAREMTEADLERDEDDPEEAVVADGPDGPDLVRDLPAADAFLRHARGRRGPRRPPALPELWRAARPRGHFCVRRNGYAH